MKNKFKYIINNFFNPNSLYYYYKHLTNSFVQVKMANKINRKTISHFKRSNSIIINTYDGSSQVVHPNVISFNDNQYMICTPYPFGMQEYENPSLYLFNTNDNLIEIGKNPIASQGEISKNHYLSDPCLFSKDGNLFCCYRETKRFDSGYINNLFFINVFQNSIPFEVFSSNNEGLMSPIVVVDDDLYKIFYITRNDTLSDVKCVILSHDYKIKSKITCIVKNIPSGFFVWHFDMMLNDKNMGKVIFLLRSKENANHFELYFGDFDLLNYEWNVTNSIVIPKTLAKFYKSCYKSCFIPGTKDILLSYITKHNEYALYRIKEAWHEK